MGEKRKRNEKKDNREKPGERGPTMCPKVLKAIADKDPLKLTWDSKGFPTGPNAKDLSSWIPVATKQYATIDTKEFRQLNPKLKEMILNRIKEAFDIPDDSHDQYLLHKAKEALRQWKCDVGRDHLYVDEETGEMHECPPIHKHPNITQAQWDEFKRYRASPEFLAKRARNKMNISKRRDKFYGSRGGYRKILEDLVAQGVTEVDRHLTYKEGHTPKDCRSLTEYDREVLGNIEKEMNEVKEGKFTPSGRDDILSRAIGRPEHPGRLRGVPLHVGVTKYFGTSTPKEKTKKKKKPSGMVKLLASVLLKMNAGGKPTEEELKLMEDIINEGKVEESGQEAEKAAASETPKEAESGQVNVSDKEMQEDTPGNKEAIASPPIQFSVFEPGKKLQEVVLTDPASSRKNPVRVARAVVDLADKGAVVHGVPLLAKHRKVEIRSVHTGQEYLALPVPVGDELTCLGQALNSFVQWPLDNIFTARRSPPKQPEFEVGATKKTDKPVSKDIPSDPVVEELMTTTSRTNEVRSLSVHKPQYASPDFMKKVRTLTMRDLYREAELRIANEQLIIIQLEPDILGIDREAVISWEALVQWSGLDEIDVMNLFVWIKYLRSEVIPQKKVPIDQYGFLCPYVLSMHITGFKIEERVDYIAGELMKKRKLILAPYNESGRHWVLAAIIPEQKTVFWLDSCHGEPTPTFMSLINKAFQKKRANEGPPTKDSADGPKFIRVPGVARQPDSVQCGYYVCRFMMEIIDRRYIQIPERFYINEPPVSEYSREQIDEIRDLWGKYVLAYS